MTHSCGCGRRAPREHQPTVRALDDLRCETRPQLRDGLEAPRRNRAYASRGLHSKHTAESTYKRRRTRRLRAEHNSPHSITKTRDVEIQQQSSRKMSKFEIGDNLGEVNWLKLLYCFDFHKQATLDNQVCPVSASERHPPIFQVEWNLRGDAQSGQLQLECQTAMICRFQKAGTQLPVDPHRGTNHAPAHPTIIPLRVLRLFVVHSSRIVHLPQAIAPVLCGLAQIYAGW